MKTEQEIKDILSNYRKELKRAKSESRKSVDEQQDPTKGYPAYIADLRCYIRTLESVLETEEVKC